MFVSKVIVHLVTVIDLDKHFVLLKFAITSYNNFQIDIFHKKCRIAVLQQVILSKCVTFMEWRRGCFDKRFNLLSDNPTKWSNTLKQFVGNSVCCILSVFDYFVELALKRLRGP